MLKQKTLKSLAFAFAAAAVLSFTLPSFVDARPSGSKSSSGSRGSHSNQSTPQTPTSNARTTQQGAPNQAARAPAPQQPGSFMSRFGAGIMGGLLGAGLFSMLSGGGLGGLGGMLMGLVQILLIVGLVMLAFRFFRKKQAAQEPAMATANGAPYSQNYQAPTAYQPSSPVAPPAPQRVDEVGITGDDYNSFDTLLGKVQDAYGRESLSELRTMVSDELYNDFSQDIADNTRKGVHNQCGGAKLLQGDLAESWRENGKDYATVALRYSLFDVTKDRKTGAVIEGSMTTPLEIAEHWTFVRDQGQAWKLSGIDQI